MHIRKSNGTIIETCGTPTSTDDQFEHWPLGATLLICYLKSFSEDLGDFLIFQYDQDCIATHP